MHPSSLVSLSISCLSFLSASPSSFSRTCLNLLWYMGKVWQNKVWHVFFQQHLQEIYEEVSRNQKTAWLAPLSCFKEYRLFFQWHLRKGRGGWMWIGSELIRKVEGKRVNYKIVLSRSNDSLIWKFAPVLVSQDYRHYNI